MQKKIGTLLIYIRRAYANRTLYQKVLFSILFFSMFPFVLLIAFSAIFIYQQQEKEVQEEISEQVQDVFDSMTYNMATIELMGKTVWADTNFIAEINRAIADGSITEYGRFMFKTQTLSVMKVITGVSQVQAARIHLDYPEMREYPPYLYRMDRAECSLWYGEKEKLPTRGRWYLDVTDQQSERLYSGYFVGDDMAAYVLPIKVSSSLTGIFEIVLPIKDMVSGIYDGQPAGDTFLMDADGRLFGIDESSQFKDIVLTDIENIMGLSSIEDYEAKGVWICRGRWKQEPVMLAIIKHESNDIFVMHIVSMRERYLKMAGLIAAALFVEACIVVMLVWSMNRIVKKILCDFTVFKECVQEVGRGNLNVEIPILKQVEVNALAIEYNRMLSNVKKLTEESIRREVMVKDAQLKALEKQINSHFLYNVLDSIKMMAEVRGIYQVSDALLALGRMFRYNLQHNGHDATLQEEITYLESYLKLCNIRYDYYVDLCENVVQSIKMLRVPKMILQPIAENSIVHGLDEQAKDTSIYLKAYVSDDVAYIEMSDMGKGIDEETLQRVRLYIKDGAGKEDHSGGIGLRNIHERIQMMYGEQYGVEIYSKEECYTKVVLRINAGGGGDSEQDFDCGR